MVDDLLVGFCLALGVISLRIGLEYGLHQVRKAQLRSSSSGLRDEVREALAPYLARLLQHRGWRHPADRVEVRLDLGSKTRRPCIMIYGHSGPGPAHSAHAYPEARALLKTALKHVPGPLSRRLALRGGHLSAISLVLEPMSNHEALQALSKPL